MKVVVSKRFGGFGLSQKALKILGIEDWYSVDDNFKFRTSPELIAVVNGLGKEANGRHANLVVVEIPDDAVDPYIEEYDGFETIKEGRSW